MVKEIENIYKELKKKKKVNPISVRQLLSYFGAQRRGWQIVADIREELESFGIETVPDFESHYIDGNLNFRLKRQKSAESVDDAEQSSSQIEIDERVETIADWASRDPTYRISKLAASNKGVVSISPTEILKKAITLMLFHDYSQLPVLEGDRKLKGVISWKSIGCRMPMKNSGDHVKDYMDPAIEVSADVSIFEVIPLIVDKDYVIVRGAENRITGIVTASDLSVQLRFLTEPFLLLGEIESMVRKMIRINFSIEDILKMKEVNIGGHVKDVSNLTFGQYVRILENNERWDSVGIDIDRKIFCENLDQIRRIRNDVMHFDPDGISEDDLILIRQFTKFIRNLDLSRVQSNS